MNQTNFLIGRGHLLTHDIAAPRRKPGKKEAYSLAEAVARLAPEFEETAAVLDALPKDACPADPLPDTVLAELCQPIPGAKMMAREVNRYGNKPRSEGPGCLAPPDAAEPELPLSL